MVSQFAVSSLPYAAPQYRPRKSSAPRAEDPKAVALARNAIPSHSFSSSSDGVMRSSSSSASAVRDGVAGSRSSSPKGQDKGRKKGGPEKLFIEIPSVSSTPRSNMSEDGSEALVTDEIAQEQYVDPLMDKCGHTYSRATWMRLPRAQDAGGVINDNLVVCPISRAIIRIDELNPNLHTREVVEYFNKNKARVLPSPARSERSDRSEEMPAWARKMEENIMERARREGEAVVAGVRKENAGLIKEIVALREEVADVRSLRDASEEREKAATKRADAAEKQIKMQTKSSCGCEPLLKFMFNR